MSTDYGNTIAKNLRKIMHEKNITAAELAKATGISKSAISFWMNGIRIPRAEGIDTLCKYLGIKRADLLQEGDYYIDPETAKIAQELAGNKDMKVLFDALRDIPPEELKIIHSMALALKKKENGD